MQPQGSSIINDVYFAKQQAQFAACSVCTELQAQVDEVMASLQAGKNAVTAQIALLQPILALLTAPTDLTKALTWIQNFITSYLTPYLVPYTTYATQLAEFEAQVAELVTAIEDAASGIPGCSITIPPIT